MELELPKLKLLAEGASNPEAAELEELKNAVGFKGGHVVAVGFPRLVYNITQGDPYDKHFAHMHITASKHGSGWVIEYQFDPETTEKSVAQHKTFKAATIAAAAEKLKALLSPRSAAH